MVKVSGRYQRAMVQIKRLCYSGLDDRQLRNEIIGLLLPIMPSDLCCFQTVDPATGLITSNVRGGIHDHAVSDVEQVFFEHLYFEEYLPAYRRLLRSGCPVNRLSEETMGNPDKAYRHRMLYAPIGLDDEIRAVLYSGKNMWGTIVMARGKNAAPYSEQDAWLLAKLAPHIGTGFRTAMQQRIAALESAAALQEFDIPGLLIYDPAGFIESYTDAAVHWMNELGELHPDWCRKELPVYITQVVSALRKSQAMLSEDDFEIVPEMARYGRNGRCVTIKAYEMRAEDDRNRKIGIILGPAVHRDLIRFQTAAYGLTAQEKAVVHLVAKGNNSLEISSKLAISPYTVQEHLSNIFDKVGVRSRREVVKKIFLANLIEG
ncbi:helix-turn-helix transcriptional regulator [Paenibacillus sp. MWE-103]|uniref:Helix-turn-helix transcriptional regulator n=1 Tax=Paenibacillus artemisiicola TaxID=1172618 RepID=A0ABS3W5H7_9BACL|nr:helix-turn-helix transcriptional regulator [Paenibacillus artemisiicola]MBO7743565.1 helix-turn-helix transcriptional regulator [Paenibacillus artemisiicola]